MLTQYLKGKISKSAIHLLSIMTFTGAFLSFSMEPMVGRLLTPIFGGSSQVWLISIMFFQGIMLLGYFYAHIISKKPSIYHIVGLGVPLLLQWPLDLTAVPSAGSPASDILLALLKHISLPFFFLSTTAVVAQNWWHSSSLNTSKSEPYFLYSLSNSGSLIALLSYPLLWEPTTGLNAQKTAWSYLYLAYVAVVLMTWLALNPKKQVSDEHAKTEVNLGRASMAQWILISLTTSSLLFATTNILTMEIGSIPLIWIPPLVIYLISFIITFKGTHHFSNIAFWLPEVAMLALLLTIFPTTLPFVLFPVFILFVIAHKRLYDSRPDPSELSKFYLCIAFGGWLGGLAVSILAPMMFTGTLEYPLAIIGTGLLSVQRQHGLWWRQASRLPGYSRFIVLMGCLIAVSLFFGAMSKGYGLRNFYGIYRIKDVIAENPSESYRVLTHGRTIHGQQYLSPDRRKEPLAYYYNDGGLEQAMRLRKQGKPVGMVGLGAGDAIAWFGRGDSVNIMEIDPDVEVLAKDHFSYLNDTQATINVTTGDARITLGKLNSKHEELYDALLIDAFSGDGIPTHLLTLEALDIYLSRISEDGLLIFHITNRFFDLRPVLLTLAESRGLHAICRISRREYSNKHHKDPSVIVMSRDIRRLQSLLKDPKWFALDNDKSIERYSAWTDDHINVLAPIYAKFKSTWFH